MSVYVVGIYVTFAPSLIADSGGLISDCYRQWPVMLPSRASGNNSNQPVWKISRHWIFPSPSEITITNNGFFISLLSTKLARIPLCLTPLEAPGLRRSLMAVIWDWCLVWNDSKTARSRSNLAANQNELWLWFGKEFWHAPFAGRNFIAEILPLCTAKQRGMNSFPQGSSYGCSSSWVSRG